jgi:hypothetical protein
MVKLLISLLLQLSYAQAMQHSGHSMDRPSTHGMAVVGTQQIYLSHLPMFHSPHDYQVILEVTLDPASQAKYQQLKDGSPDEFVTMVPETFVLPEIVTHPHPFKAVFYKGHFERGGHVFIDEATVTIKQTIYFKKFSPMAVKLVASRYIVFGNSSEQFLAHEITAKPDFDQLVRVKFQGTFQNLIGQTVEFTDQPNDQPLKSGEKPHPQVEVLNNIYLEFGDLAM